MVHVAEYKKKIVKNICDLITEYPIIGAVNMENLPAPQLQGMKEKLRGKVEIIMAKRRLINIALDNSKEKKKGIEKLKESLIGMPALIFTKENPFALFKELKKNKSTAPAKAGQKAPNDIIVSAGPTSFAPGPIISELGAIGLKTGVENGKVAIKEDSVVAKEGEVITAKKAEVLTRLGIKPMEVGLGLTAIYEKGVIYKKDVLDIDEDKFMSDLRLVASSSFNLAMFIGYPTKDTIKQLIGKAFNDSKALAISQNILCDATIGPLLGKAEAAMLSLKNTAKIEVPEKKKEPKAEKPKEQPKEEQKPETKEKPKPIPKVQETKLEEKEERIIEEERKILDEEREIEKSQSKAKKPKIEAPVEQEVKKEVAEEEEKQLEKERIEKEKELEKIEEQKKAEEEARKKQEEIKKLEEEAKKKEKELKEAEAQKKAEEEKKLQEEKKKKAEEERKKRQEEKRVQEEAKKREEEEKEESTENKVADMVKRMKNFSKTEKKTAESIINEVKKESIEDPKDIKKEEEQKEDVPTAAELANKSKQQEQKKAEELVQELIKKGTLRK